MTNIDQYKNGKTYVDGPWTDEPDHSEFRHLGLPCMVHRGPSGAWCGYVAVPLGHPWHSVHEMKIDADVHGGLTYGNKCQGSICHIPKEGESDDVYWLGFDCAHCDDITPSDTTRAERDPEYPSMRGYGARYRSMEFAKSETIRLAAQARTAQGWNHAEPNQ